MAEYYDIIDINDGVALMSDKDGAFIVEVEGKKYYGDTFAPLGGGLPLRAEFRDLAREMIEKNAKKSEMSLSVDPVPAETAQEQGARHGVPATSVTVPSTLEGMIAGLIADNCVGKVMSEVKPMIDRYVKCTYGTLPTKTIVVKSEKGEKKVKGVVAKEFKNIVNLVAMNMPVYLSGPSGCGKNVICKQVSEALGLEFYFSNAVTQEYKLTGFVDANGRYHETQFYKAFTQGGLFMLDEMDASVPEVLVILNAAIANGYFDFPNGKAEAHSDFRVVAAGNTLGGGANDVYTGRYQLDASSLDRFSIVPVDYDENVEAALSGDDKEILEFVRSLRKAFKKEQMNGVVSYRTIERLAKMRGVVDIQDIIRFTVLRGMDESDLKLLYNNLEISDKNIYKKAMKGCL